MSSFLEELDKLIDKDLNKTLSDEEIKEFSNMFENEERIIDELF